MKTWLIIFFGFIILLAAWVWFFYNAPFKKTVIAPTPTPDLIEKMKNAGTSLANPATVYCRQSGGDWEIRTAADGSQSGWCTLPDGKVCEEWEYFKTKKCE